MFIKSLQVCFVILLVSGVAAWASPVGPSILQGDVKDSKLQPVAGAEVHIQAKDGSGLQKIVRTDAGGHYVVSKLPNTDYEVVLFVNGAIKASIGNTKTYADKPTQLDFKLTGQYATNKPVKKHTHMVYVPAETGSNLSGRWVEVDDNSGTSDAATAGTGKVEHVSGAALRQMQTGGYTGGGH
jgi:Carboxypeptidase regulatory-like domain